MRLAVLVALVGCSSPATTKPAPPQQPKGSPFERFDAMSPKVGELAPDFELTDLTGRRVKLSDATARGPVVLVWGSFT